MSYQCHWWTEVSYVLARHQHLKRLFWLWQHRTYATVYTGLPNSLVWTTTLSTYSSRTRTCTHTTICTAKASSLMIIILISSTVSGLYMNKSVNPVFVNVSCGQTKQHSPVKCFNSTNSHRWIQDSTFQLVTGNITFTGASMCGPGPFATA